jgi:hypothetical protein
VGWLPIVHFCFTLNVVAMIVLTGDILLQVPEDAEEDHKLFYTNLKCRLA